VIRAVIDTNVIVSGLISGKNPPGIIIDSWLYGRFISIISEDMIEEISHTLKKPVLRELIDDNIEIILMALIDRAECVKIKKYFHVCQDKDDDGIQVVTPGFFVDSINTLSKEKS